MPKRDVVPVGNGGSLVPRETAREMVQINGEVMRNQAAVRGVSSVTEYALSEAAYLTRMRNQLEAAVPDATEALALIANTATMSIARIVHRFGSEVS
ncbi:hypothetical protein [Frankia sp. BMG5.23]|uniref:hypothetical protein n=1 Tax=Frankia sp. BMG5.23 TaxID=683305 RepID=UPI0004614E1C|nr:hypothetical protein [Frankia sp. BMG5.23]KDA44521.1 hypothetical protein BMG523Draft_00698 [Frankia sp. BMG5.23]